MVLMALMVRMVCCMLKLFQLQNLIQNQMNVELAFELQVVFLFEMGQVPGWIINYSTDSQSPPHNHMESQWRFHFLVKK